MRLFELVGEYGKAEDTYLEDAEYLLAYNKSLPEGTIRIDGFVNEVETIPMMCLSRLTGAWYQQAEDDPDEPDGWLVIRKEAP